jgi:predicted phosphodiesterase
MHSLKRTRRTLQPQTISHLRGLPDHRVIEGNIVLTHGGVRDVQQYMTQPRHFAQNAMFLRHDFPAARVCFYGHTHEQRIVEVGDEQVREIPVAERVRLRSDRRYFVNPGSVDASRKHVAKLAECAIFDSVSLELQFHRLPYDDLETEAKAEAQGYRIDRWRDRLYDWQRRVIGPRQVDAS